MDRFKISLVQMKVTNRKEDNLRRALELIRQAAEEKPDLIVLPENFYLFESKEELFKQAETIDGHGMTQLREAAREHGVHLVTGTMKLKADADVLLRNVCCVVNPNGDIQAMYNKIHVFNASIGGSEFRGNEAELGGDDIVVTSVKGVQIGLSICFDMRFPEMYRILALKGAQVILVPSMFMLHTGKDHWEPLLRARAIENQLYIAAPATLGQIPPKGDWTYGRSLFIDPWGTVIGQAPDEETVLTMSLDLKRIQEVRRMVPSLAQRRPEVYKWP